MLSFLSRAFVVSKVGILGSTSLCLPTTWRFFSQSQTRYATPEDPEARRKRLDKNNERRRQRYQNDPDYREKVIARQALNNPLHRDQTKQAMRLRTRIWHEQMRDQKPEVLEQFLERTRLAAARSRAGDPRFKFRVNLHKCLVSHAWEPEELPWKTHVPMVSAEKVFRQCARCDRSPPGGGLRLWWKSRKDNTKEEAEEYLCQSCYIPKENWQDALPQGYEDVKSMKELVDRKKKLDRGDHGSRSVDHPKSK